jgi:hypothetical protein
MQTKFKVKITTGVFILGCNDRPTIELREDGTRIHYNSINSISNKILEQIK